MSVYLWFKMDRATGGAWHMVAEDTDQTRTLCGLDVTDVTDFRDDLGEHRPCDNCTEIAARHADAGDQPAEVPS